MADSVPEVEVLLATLNGERFLPDQMASVLGQAGVRVRVVARDDGSSDGTAGLLAEAEAKAPGRIFVVHGEPATGSAAGNFAELMRASTGEYVALCDQDDVWEADKLRLCLKAMRGLEQRHGGAVPLLVFTDLEVVDEALRPVAGSLWERNGIGPATVRRMGRLLGENVVTGCTVLMNRRMVELAGRMPAGGVAMHDHWIALVACALGRSAWVAEPTVKYRQHGENVVGAAKADESLRGRLGRLLGGAAVARRERVAAVLQAQAGLFEEMYGEMLSEEQRRVVRAYATLGRAGVGGRLWRMVRFDFWRGTLARNVVAVVDLLR